MKHWSQSFEVPSTSGLGTYTVSRDTTGRYACSCPHWIYRRQVCKHIRAIQTQARTEPAHHARDLPIPTCLPANVTSVTTGDDKSVLVPLIPIGHSHFLATVIVDLLIHRISFATIQRHYHLPAATTRQNYLDHVLAHGRFIYAERDEGQVNRQIVHTEQWQLPESPFARETAEQYHRRTGVPLDLIRLALPRLSPTSHPTGRRDARPVRPAPPRHQLGQRRIILSSES